MTVYLVGAGPGDPGLLTRRGAEVLGRADVVVYDRLAEPALLELAPPTAERIDVGKRPGAAVDQGSINALLVERGAAGLTVVRLKGGDPFVFGRGGEEALALAGAGVAFEVVPGVSAALAAPAYAGIPVTHRGTAASFTVVTGHSRHDPDPEPEWELLARAGGTIVVLMGVAHRDRIAARLMDGGLPGGTPVAAVQWGTHLHQLTVRTTLAGLGAAEMDSPAVIVIGAVAALELDWFTGRPLWGRRVVLTRASDRSAELAEALRQAGAEVLEVPVTATAPASDGGEGLDLVAPRLGSFDWVAFASVNAVTHLFAHVRDARAFGPARVAAVGPATAAALAGRGVEADLVSPTGSAAGLADALGSPPAGGGSVLLPRSEQAGRELPEALAAGGWVVVEVSAYRTVPVPVPPEMAERVAGADAVVFAAGSAVSAYLEAGLRVPPVVACLGPSTAEAVRSAGLSVAAVAERPEPAAVVDALAAALGSKTV
ncbi:MAG TPA: uroporphyrinogen-III C-methyltransferase [Acidimicrobiales bacterium]|nr:uroporphyrinogen-III C-methyltransferase [Acidimicrobiales bacterium]